MTAPNHITGGIVFTGIFSSVWDVNIFSNPYYLPFILVVSILPDIDHTKSLIGKMFYPLSRWIQRNHGHRTITHTLFCWVALTLIVKMFDSSGIYTFLFSLAYFSHLLFDMMTVQGIPFLYPFLKNPYVIPGKTEMRLKTGDLRGETVYFCLFLISGIFFYPLMTNGFWTQYNRAFSTIQHVHSEFKKNEVLVRVDYKFRREGKRVKGTGYVIDSKQTDCVLFDKYFTFLNNNDMIIEQVYPTPSDSMLSLKTKYFVHIELDSLNKLIDKPLYKCEIEASESVMFNRKKKTIFESDFVNELVVNELPKKAVNHKKSTKHQFHSNPRIKSLKSEISNLVKADDIKRKSSQVNRNEIERIKADIEKADIVKKEILMTKLHDLEKIYKPFLPNAQIQVKRTKLNELIELDKIKRKEVYQKNSLLEESPIEQNIYYSGVLKFVGYENVIPN